MTTLIQATLDEEIYYDLIKNVTQNMDIIEMNYPLSVNRFMKQLSQYPYKDIARIIYLYYGIHSLVEKVNDDWLLTNVIREYSNNKYLTEYEMVTILCL